MITYTVTTFSFVDELEFKDKAVSLSEVLFLVALIFSWIRSFMKILKSRYILPSDVLFCFVLFWRFRGELTSGHLNLKNFSTTSFMGSLSNI